MMMPIASFKDKWIAFGWQVSEIDGHDYEAIEGALKEKSPSKTPRVILAQTIKGKGIREFEDTMQWHYWAPKTEQLKAFYQQIDENSIR